MGEAFNKILDFMEREDSLLRHVLTRWLLLWPAMEKILKCWPEVKSYFKVWNKKNIFIKFRSLLRVRIEKRITEKKIYMLFCQNYLMIFEETIRSLEKDELIAPQLFDDT